jgi:hypothetical protein
MRHWTNISTAYLFRQTVVVRLKARICHLQRELARNGHPGSDALALCNWRQIPPGSHEPPREGSHSGRARRLPMQFPARKPLGVPRRFILGALARGKCGLGLRRSAYRAQYARALHHVLGAAGSL